MTTVTAALDSRMTETDSITCMLADDHPAVLDSISRVLASQGFDVVAQARDGEDALKAIEAQKPQVSIVDLRMPGMSGIAVARRATRR
jgi:two-component system response regulator EvgA